MGIFDGGRNKTAVQVAMEIPSWESTGDDLKLYSRADHMAQRALLPMCIKSGG